MKDLSTPKAVKRYSAFDNVLTVILAIVSLLWISPILIVFMNSFKRKAYIFRNPFSISAYELSEGFDKWMSGVKKSWFGLQNYINGINKTDLIKVFGTSSSSRSSLYS